jgi:predicted nucleic acid-binding protein
MSGIDFVADTNVLIYFLEGNKNLKSFQDNNFAVSVISEIEMLGWYKIAEEEKNIIRLFLDSCFVIELLPAIKEIAIGIRQKHKMKLPDAVVAATAIYLDAPLITADKQFSKIPNLKLLIVSF